MSELTQEKQLHPEVFNFHQLAKQRDKSFFLIIYSITESLCDEYYFECVVIDPIVSLVTTVKEIAKTMFVNTNVSCIISFSFSFSLLYCHKKHTKQEVLRIQKLKRGSPMETTGIIRNGLSQLIIAKKSPSMNRIIHVIINGRAVLTKYIMFRWLSD